MRAVTSILLLLLLAGCGQDGGGTATTAPSPTPGVPADAPAEVTDFDSPPPHDGEPGPLEPSEPFDLATITVTDGDARVRIPSYVAYTNETRQRGLMFREELPAEAGMIFLFPGGERTGGFWMRNTLIPLSILFYGPEGDVRAVLDMDPCEADPCPTYDPEVSYVGAIEVNQGYFDEIGLDESWTVELPDGLPEPR